MKEQGKLGVKEESLVNGKRLMILGGKMKGFEHRVG